VSERPEGPPADPQGSSPPSRQGWWDAWPGLGWRGRKTWNPKAGSGRRAINEDRNARALKVRQGSWALDASKSHQRTKEAAHPPAYWDSGLHRRASEGEDENAWSPTARQVGDTVAWVQVWEAAYFQNKPNPAAHQGGGTCAPPGRTALPGSAALVGPATSGKNKGKTGQSASAANFLSAQEPQLKEETAIAHGVRGASPSRQVGGAWSAKNQGITGQGVSAAGLYWPRNLMTWSQTKNPRQRMNTDTPRKPPTGKP
jgi:hypothetical protein